MRPLLAHVYEPHRVSFPCFVQPKLNGIRALYQNGRFQSRDEQPFHPDVLAHLAEPLLRIFGPEVILDGELYHHGWPLQRINGAVTPVRKEEKEDTRKVEYHVFDVVDFNKAFEDRKDLFEELPEQGPLFPVKTIIVQNYLQADHAYAKNVGAGFEGMMYRLGDCPYTVPKQRNEAKAPDWKTWDVKSNTRFLSDQNNRCWHLLKRKSWQDEDFVVTGVVEGEGKYENMVGALKYNSRPGNPWMRDKLTDGGDPTVSGGLTDAQREKYWEHPELITGHTIKVKFLCLSEAGIPLNPTILAIL